MIALLLFTACGESTMEVGDPNTRPDDDDDSGVPDDSGEDTDTGDPDTGDTSEETGDDTSEETGDDTSEETGDTGPVEYDCAAPPSFNLGDTTLADARAYHGVTFDDDGHLIGWDGRNALVKSSYDGTREVFVPGMRGVEGMDRLPDGDWVIADSTQARLARVTSEGGTETLASNVGYAYGVTIGPDQMIYYTDGGIHRVDPETGETTTIIAANEMPRGTSAHVINFNLDSTVMYVGTIGRGDVYYLELDEYLEPTTNLVLFASGVGQGWHDGLGVDVCGNLYLADYSSAGLYRVAPDGTVTDLVTPGDLSLYGHGLEWGSGIGGWREDALYQPQPYGGNKVREVVVGIPSGDSVRTWNGVKVPW